MRRRAPSNANRMVPRPRQKGLSTQERRSLVDRQYLELQKDGPPTDTLCAHCPRGPRQEPRPGATIQAPLLLRWTLARVEHNVCMHGMLESRVQMR